MRNLVLSILIALSTCSPAFAQQRPLVTEDPETIGLGLVLVEGGFDYQQSVFYPVSGLEGNLLRLPTLGVSFGISSIAELQIDGGLYNRLSVESRKAAPLSSALDFTGDNTSDVEDITIATKIRLAAEKPGRPAVGVRFATRLPNASNESGLGLDTTDFYVSALVGKTVQSVRVVGNLGLGILGEPTNGNSQNDVLTYGVSFARAVQEGVEIVGEINGRLDTREGDPPPGTESRGAFRVGGRITRGTVRLDGGIIIGMTSRDASFGVTAGLTWVFRGK
jgi:Putative MetA-pathway of phenol degradation